MSYWIRRFELPSVRSKGFPEGWGIIIVDSKGLFSAYSDFGNYTYHWSSFGDDFVKFLLSIDDDYLSRKICRNYQVYDGEGTLKAVQEAVTQAVEEKDLSEDDAEEERRLIKRCHDLYDTEDFSEWLRETRLTDALELVCRKTNPQLQGFLTNIWPRFKGALQENHPQPPRKPLSRLSPLKPRRPSSRKRNDLPLIVRNS
jgi:hypothetical protein